MENYNTGSGQTAHDCCLSYRLTNNLQISYHCPLRLIYLKKRGNDKIKLANYTNSLCFNE